MILHRVFLFSIALLIAAGCQNSSTDSEAAEEEQEQQLTARSFSMGFTTFPYSATSEAQQSVYDGIAQHADIVAHHFDNGVPWVEALSGDPFHPNIIAEWQGRLDNIPDGHRILLSITPISITRDALALYRGENPDMPLPDPWNTYGFNHPDVIAAYVNYSRRIIQFFDPDWVILGIESNLLKANVPGDWDAYAELHRETYVQLKEAFPRLPLAASMTGVNLLEGYTDTDLSAQRAALDDLLSHMDFLGISLYPYFSKYLTDEIPNDMFDEVFALSGGKQIGFTETGYPAESFSVFDGSLVFNSSISKQNSYIDQLLEACQANGAAFAINFVYRDYDQLWQQIGSPDDVNKMWRDTGLLDEDGAQRPAFDTWKNWLNKPLTN
ncbi:MAG: hypothetical protein R3224_04115 [Balneolaceae bacterium]|nr:hypothetical protein [Balneolaceae bacterium]